MNQENQLVQTKKCISYFLYKTKLGYLGKSNKSLCSKSL